MRMPKKLLEHKVGSASVRGKDWMFDKWVDIDNKGGSLKKGMSFSDFQKALKDDPSFPTFGTEQETEAAYKGAWDEYVDILEDEEKDLRLEDMLIRTFIPKDEKEGD